MPDKLQGGDGGDAAKVIEMRRIFKAAALAMLRRGLWPVAIVAVEEAQSEEPKCAVIPTVPFPDSEVYNLVRHAAAHLPGGTDEAPARRAA